MGFRPMCMTEQHRAEECLLKVEEERKTKVNLSGAFLKII